MPKHEQTIQLNTIDKETALAISYQAMKDLGWTVQYAGEEKLLGKTPKDWKNFPLQIMVTVANDSLTVSSEMVSGESFDMRSKNKKATTAFLAAFETAQKTIPTNSVENNKAAITTLREATLKAAEQEQQQAAEIDRAMNLSGSNLYVTYSIIAVNVLVFILMAMDGAGIMETNGLVHIKWGSDYIALTLSGDWWRLITSTFIHFGIIHLLMNMYCLYMVGVYLEPMLGKAKYTIAYLCTGVLASVISLWWHRDIAEYNSAGASGAIFGMYGLFLALLSTNLIPKQMRMPLLQSIGIFVVYNLVYGMKGGVDNAAHVGGLVSGFLTGFIYVFSIKKEREGQKLQWVIPVVIALTVGTAYGYLEQHKMGRENRDKILAEIKDVTTHGDIDSFDAKYNEFVELQKKAISIVYDTTLTKESYIQQLKDTAEPNWDKAEALMKETTTMNVSDAMHKKADDVIQYIELRKQEIAIKKELLDNKSESVYIKLNETVDKIDSVLNRLQK